MNKTVSKKSKKQEPTTDERVEKILAQPTKEAKTKEFYNQISDILKF